MSATTAGLLFGGMPAYAGAAPAVAIASPVAGGNVAGTVTVAANASPDAVRAEFLVDGVLQGSDPTAPFEFRWDTGVNPLPSPNHPIDFGYFLADGRYGDFCAEVNGYTNLYHAWARRGYEPHAGAGDDEWLPLMAKALARAAAQGRRIQLNLNLQEEAPGRVTPVDRVLDIAASYWDRVVRIELADEPAWSRAQTEAQIAALQARLRARGLPLRPMGNIYTRQQALTDDAVFAANQDFVMIEAYVDPPGNPDSQVNIDLLIQALTAAKQRIPVSKQLGFVMQAYARNYAWTDIDNLRDLQVPTYLLAHDDPRVVAITMFSYGRPSGTREFQQLRTPHRLIGERVLGRSVPLAGHGQRTLVVKAYDAAGASARHRITVRAQASRPGDFLENHRADTTVYDRATSRWAIQTYGEPSMIFEWGRPGDIPVAGDHLGRGKLATTTFRPSTGHWSVFSPATGETALFAWGTSGDVPLSGNFVGDGRADLAVYRPSDNVWYVRDQSTGETLTRRWGLSGDIPVVGDFLGDDRAEFTVYRNGAWYILNPATGETAVHGWGVRGDIPVSGDFLGDGRTDLAVFRPSDGIWYVRDPNTGQTLTRSWGTRGDIPVGADYFGDGRTELTVYRPSAGRWYILDAGTGRSVEIPWGDADDVPIA